MKAKKILIVEDEVPIREMVRLALEKANFECSEAGDIQAAYLQVVDHTPDLILLDWMLPGNSGIELIRRLKRESLYSDIPIIMLTARIEEDNKIQGLDAGADDYITKPFSPRELIARVNALFRRLQPDGGASVLSCQGLELDEESHRVFIDKEAIDIGPTEFKLLLLFLSHKDRAFTRAQILDHVWGGNVYVEERTVDVHIRRLRKALRTRGDDGVDYGSFIQTVRGTGYRFSELE